MRLYYSISNLYKVGTTYPQCQRPRCDHPELCSLLRRKTTMDTFTKKITKKQQ